MISDVHRQNPHVLFYDTRSQSVIYLSRHLMRIYSLWATLLVSLVASCFSFTSSAQHLTKIIPDEGGILDNFGQSIAMSGDRIIVGAPFKDSHTTDTGAAFIFERQDSIWIQKQTLTASNDTKDTRFGQSVSIHHDLAIASSLPEERAIVFEYNGSTWEEVMELKPFNNAPAKNFGKSVAITDDFAFVSSGEDLVTQNAGAVYVYQRQADGTWAPFQKLFASNRIKFGLFGFFIDVHGDDLAIGSPRTNGDVAAVYVYKWTGKEWIEKDILYTPTEFTVGNEQVDIHEDHLIVGVPRSIEIERYAGAAFIYDRVDGQWAEPEKELVNEGRIMNYFGSAVAINNDYAVIGATHYNSTVKETGVAIVYEQQQGNWEESYRIIPFDAAEKDRFGADADMSGGFVAVSTIFDDDLGGGSGAVYIHILTGAPKFYTAIDSTARFAALGQVYQHRTHATGIPTPMYSLAEAPENMEIDAESGLITWVPQSTGTFNVSVLASNNTAVPDTQSYAIKVLTPPSITTQPDTLAVLGNLYTYDVNATADPTASYMLNTAPSGMVIDDSTGVIQWTPTAGGRYEVIVSADNNVNPADSQRFHILAGLPPTILSEPDTVAIGLEEYVYDVLAEGFPPPLFFLTSAPEGMSIDSLSGRIQWTPQETGAYNVAVVAENSFAPADTQQFIIQVSTLVNTEEDPLPTQTTVSPAYPNPFSTKTTIPYQLATASSVRVKVVDITGKQIYTHVYPHQEQGTHELTWQGSDSSGAPIPAGLYFLVVYLGDASTPHVIPVVRI